jgi:hypothetical protein
VVALEEAVTLVEATQSEFADPVAGRLRKQAEKKAVQAQQLRKLLQELEPFRLE